MKETFKEFCARILPIVKAGANGDEVEFSSDGGSEWVSKKVAGFSPLVQYRIAEPKATPLPITPEMWAMIDPRYKFAYLFASGTVLFSVVELKWNGFIWILGPSLSNHCESPLAIDTTGIIPELSLTKRPDVIVNNKEDLYKDERLAQNEFFRFLQGDTGKAKYTEDEIKAIIDSAREGWKDGVKAVLKEFDYKIEGSSAGETQKNDDKEQVTFKFIYQAFPKSIY